MLGKQEWYNREGGRWVSVMTITTKHEHSNRNLEHTGARAHHRTPHEPRTTYHESRPHQHHKLRTTRTISTRTRNGECGNKRTSTTNHPNGKFTGSQRQTGGATLTSTSLGLTSTATTRASTPTQGH